MKRKFLMAAICFVMAGTLCAPGNVMAEEIDQNSMNVTDIHTSENMEDEMVGVGRTKALADKVHPYFIATYGDEIDREECHLPGETIHGYVHAMSWRRLGLSWEEVKEAYIQEFGTEPVTLSYADGTGTYSLDPSKLDGIKDYIAITQDGQVWPEVPEPQYDASNSFLSANEIEIQCLSQDANGVVAEMVQPQSFVMNRWLSYNVNTGEWTILRDWERALWNGDDEFVHNSNKIRFKPTEPGEYWLRCEEYLPNVQDPSQATADTIGFSWHPAIQGKCQMPYTGTGGEYLIGVKSYPNANTTYSYELLVLDCTKLMAGDPNPWIYSTGKCGGQNDSFWTVWQPQYGYYWTLFRVYDANGNLVDEDCYGFQNV